jgi:hypothetical protein
MTTFRSSLLLAFLCAALSAQTLRPVEVVTTDKVELGAGGTIRITGSTGELNVEEWDRPEVEVTVRRFTESEPKDRDAVKKLLDSIKVETRKSGANEVTVSTELPKHGLSGVAVDYRIRAPKDAKLNVRHGKGDVVITGFTGGIDAQAKNAEIFVMLPVPNAYAIQAKAKIGTIYSDFEGTRKRVKLTGSSFEGKSEGAAAKPVVLDVANGGITVQEMSR